MDKPDLVVNGHTFHWNARTYIMGVINVTPDSFSDGGRFLGLRDARRQAGELVKHGADIIDVGGESSRPFSEPVPVEEELARVIPVIREIRRFTDIPVSIDTTKAEVARIALEEGADIINDVSAMRQDAEMTDLAVRSKAPVILMHMKGTPRDMQVDPAYDDVVAEVRNFLKERLEWSTMRGVRRDRIIIDPGIGFGKTFVHNAVLLNRLNELADLKLPILAGPSRKAFLGAITGTDAARERDVATLGAVAVAAMRGAAIVRVHNVGMTREVLRVVNAICTETV